MTVLGKELEEAEVSAGRELRRLIRLPGVTPRLTGTTLRHRVFSLALGEGRTRKEKLDRLTSLYLILG